MAIALTRLEANDSGTAGTTFTTASVSPTANDLQLFVVVTVASGAAPSTTVSGAGMTTWTLVKEVVFNTTTRISVFRALQSSPTTGAGTITTGGTVQHCWWAIYDASGAATTGTNGADAVPQSVSNSGTGTSISATLAALSNSTSVAFATFFHNSFEATTPSSGYTDERDWVVSAGTAFDEDKLNDTTPSASWASSVAAGVIALEIAAPFTSPSFDATPRQMINPFRKALVGMGMIILAASAVVGYGVAGGVGGGGGSFTANVYLSPASGGNGQAACTKSSTLITYASAVSGGNVCHSLEKACAVAAGGIIGVKAGTYPDQPGSSTLPNGEDGFDNDCGSSGNNVNPNSVEQGGGAVTSMSGWAEFRCADGDTSSAQFSIPNLYMRTNAHAYIHGGCFRFHNVFVDYGGDSGLNAQNIVFRGVTNRIYFDAIEVHGGKNIGVYFWEQGPYAICAGTATVPANGANDKCSANTTTGEAQYQSRSGPDDGPAPAACTQSCGGNTDQQGGQFPWVGRNISGSSINVRFEDGISHDSQSRDNTPWHTGCGHIFQNNSTGANGTDNANASSNVVIDGYQCYRTDVFGFYVEGSEGVTIQNSSFGCPSGPVGQNGTLTGNWYLCTSTQPGIEVICQNGPSTLTNVLIRYNSVATFATMRGDTCTGGYSNVRVVGNVFEQGGNSCEAGVTWDYNAYGDGGCSGDTHKFASIANPFTTDDRTTISYPPSSSQTLSSNVGFNPTLTAGTKPFEHQLPTTGDFALLVDQSGNSRPANGQSLNTAGAVSR